MTNASTPGMARSCGKSDCDDLLLRARGARRMLLQADEDEAVGDPPGAAEAEPGGGEERRAARARQEDRLDLAHVAVGVLERRALRARARCRRRTPRSSIGTSSRGIRRERSSRASARSASAIPIGDPARGGARRAGCARRPGRARRRSASKARAPPASARCRSIGFKHARAEHRRQRQRDEARDAAPPPRP